MFWKTFIPRTLSHVSKFTSRLTWLWQLPPSSQTLVPGWEVGVNDLESDNRGRAIQWDATSCFAYHDLIPIHPFLPPLLYGSFGGLLHTEQQMFFSWYYMQIFQAAAQSWYYHMRNIMTLTFLLPLNHFPDFLWSLRIYNSVYNNNNCYYFSCCSHCISIYLFDCGTYSNFLPFFLISTTNYSILLRLVKFLYNLLI